MTIMDEIRRCAYEYEISTGFKPTRVYLGHSEMLGLGKWTDGAGYKSEQATGKDKWEVMGMKVYEVNDDRPHVRCCV